MTDSLINVAFKDKFTADFRMSYQQETSLLQDTVDADFSQDGNNIYFDFVGKGSTKPRTRTGQQTEHNPPPFSRRVIRASSAMYQAYLSQSDVVKLMQSPKNKWQRAGIAAHKRDLDDAIIAAARGSAYAVAADKTETAIALPSAQKIATGSGGLTFLKVRQAYEKLTSADVPPEDLFAIIGPKQNQDLLNLSPATSSDYTSKRIIDKGSIDGETWMGFTWRVSNRLPLSSTTRYCLFYHKYALGLYMPIDLTVKMAEDPAHSFDTALHIEQMMGATRVQDAGVVEVACTES